MFMKADFTSFNGTGAYRLLVPGMGRHWPFRIDEHCDGFCANLRAGDLSPRSAFQRAGAIHAVYARLPTTTAPAGVPTNASAPFAFTWYTISNYVSDINPEQSAANCAATYQFFSRNCFPL